MTLLPCNFCGGTDLKVVDDGLCKVKCLSCLCGGPAAETDQEAMEKWNKRIFTEIRSAEALSGSVCFGCRQRDEWLEYLKRGRNTHAFFT